MFMDSQETIPLSKEKAIAYLGERVMIISLFFQMGIIFSLVVLVRINSGSLQQRSLMLPILSLTLPVGKMC